MTLSYRTYRLEPIYKAQFGDSSYGYRPGRCARTSLGLSVCSWRRCSGRTRQIPPQPAHPPGLSPIRLYLE